MLLEQSLVEQSLVEQSLVEQSLVEQKDSGKISLKGYSKCFICPLVKGGWEKLRTCQTKIVLCQRPQIEN